MRKKKKILRKRDYRNKSKSRSRGILNDNLRDSTRKEWSVAPNSAEKSKHSEKLLCLTINWHY